MIYKLRSESDLVHASHNADILSKLEGGRVVFTGKRWRPANAESSGNTDEHQLRYRDVHVDSEIRPIESLNVMLLDLRAIQRCMEAARERGQQIGVAQNHRMDPIHLKTVAE